MRASAALSKTTRTRFVPLTLALPLRSPSHSHFPLPLPQRQRKADVDAAARLSALGPATLGSNAMRLAVLGALGRILPLCFPPPAIMQARACERECCMQTP